MCFDVGQVRNPKPVRCRRPKLAINQVGWPVQPVIALGRDRKRLAPSGSGQPFGAHQTFNGATRHTDLFAVQLGPDLVGAIDKQVLLEHPVHLGNEFNIA